jgi:hypothetical protein
MNCCRLFSIFLAVSCLLFHGCGPNEESRQSSNQEFSEPKNSQTANEQLRSNATLQQFAETAASDQTAGQQPANINSFTESESERKSSSGAEILATPPAEKDSTPKQDPLSLSSGTTATGLPKVNASEITSRQPSLSDDWSPEKLVEFLSITDRDMQDIWGRMQQIQGGREELIRIAKLKLQAAQNLKSHAEASNLQKSLGARGELQALSHLASFNDVTAARELRVIAESNLDSPDTSLASDSRLVLIGFALEGLKQGDETAKTQLMSYLLNIPKSTASNDVPTLMVLGQARDTLAAYGEQQLASEVRDKILDLYQDSPNVDLRTAANDLANHVYYDQVETLLNAARNGKPIETQQWTRSIKTLIDQTGDMRCVQYLAGAALQHEGRGSDELVHATFEILRNSFPDPKSDVAQEVNIAARAYQTRQSVIGTEFKFDLPLITQESLRVSEYQGKVLLVPFWTVTLPESLQIMKLLESIRDKNPEQVAILGINLDNDDTLLGDFLRQNKLPFQNLHARSAISDEGPNPTAEQFGITSMPFLAIVDSQRKIAAINFTGQGIEEVVTRLLATTSQPTD